MNKEEILNKNIAFKKETLILLCLAALVFLIHIRYLGSLGIFTVLDDEFGYWGNAAYLAGLDWSDAVSEIPYYSYGYSLLLVPLFWIFDNPVNMYKAAIILNGIMLSASFLICYNIARKLMPALNKHILMAISFLISMYPSYIAYSSIAWPECLLIFICWLLMWCFTGLNEKSSNYKFILIGFLSIYIYIVHQRALGILIASIFVILLMKILAKINWKQFLCFVLPTILLLIIHYYLKNDIQSHLWLNDGGSLTNDYSYQVSKIHQLFTIAGLTRAFKIFLGQFFYLGAASYLLCYLGLYELIQRLGRILINFIKNKNVDILDHNDNLSLYSFLLVAFLLSMVISVISMINPIRTDHIVYGRYMDMILGPIILLGLLRIMEKEIISIKTILSILVGFSLLTVAVYSIIIEFNLGELHILNVVGLVLMSISVYLPAIVAIIAFILMFLSLIRKNEKTIIVSIIVIAFLFFITGESIKRYIVINNQEKLEIMKIVDLTTKKNLPVYYLWDDQNNPAFSKWDKRNIHDRLIVDCYQFLFKEKPIKIVNVEELNAIDGDNFVLSAEIYYLFDLMDVYKFCMSNKYSYLLASETSTFGINYCDNTPPNTIEIPLEIFDATNANVNENYLQGDGTQGIFMQGLNKQINPGQYLFLLDMELVEYMHDELGYAEVYSSTDEKTLNKTKINASEFDENNRLFFEIPFEFRIYSDYIGLRLYANEGTQLRVNNVYIRR